MALARAASPDTRPPLPYSLRLLLVARRRRRPPPPCSSFQVVLPLLLPLCPLSLEKGPLVHLQLLRTGGLHLGGCEYAPSWRRSRARCHILSRNLREASPRLTSSLSPPTDTPHHPLSLHMTTEDRRGNLGDTRGRVLRLFGPRVCDGDIVHRV
ncbi:hypothetical protein F4802DRAFT_544496 [Xylaria palmicola]|nr:hypothetical protein F4802DRAFT_544496 [Xylaria palmicola]